MAAARFPTSRLPTSPSSPRALAPPVVAHASHRDAGTCGARRCAAATSRCVSPSSAAAAYERGRGIYVRPVNNYPSGPEETRLFLDAGMNSETLAPGATETLMLEVLASGCSKPHGHSSALMLLAAGKPR